MTQEAPQAAPVMSESQASESETPPAVQAVEQASEQETEAKQEQQEEQKPSYDDDFVRRFNALSRREREILQREQQFKEQYGQYEGYQKERELLKKDPVGFLEKNGWSFQDLADYVLNDRKKTPDMQVSELQKKIEALETERREERERKEQAEQQKKYQEIIDAHKEKIKTTVNEAGEKYELISHFGEYDMVYDVIDAYYRNNGSILDIDKAAAEVEKYLEDRFSKAVSTNKLKKRFNLETPAPSETKPESMTSEQAFTPPPRTLTNDSVVNSLTADNAQQEYLSDDESKRRAAEFLKRELLKRQGYSKD